MRSRALAEVVATENVEPGAVLVTSRRYKLGDSRPSSKGSPMMPIELVRVSLPF
jgi:hypothetical protein